MRQAVGHFAVGADDRECHVRLLVLDADTFVKTCRIMMWMLTRTVTVKCDFASASVRQ